MQCYQKSWAESPSLKCMDQTHHYFSIIMKLICSWKPSPTANKSMRDRKLQISLCPQRSTRTHWASSLVSRSFVRTKWQQLQMNTLLQRIFLPGWFMYAIKFSLPTRHQCCILSPSTLFENVEWVRFHWCFAPQNHWQLKSFYANTESQ